MKYVDKDGKTIIQLEAWPIIDIHDTMGFLFDEGKIEIPRRDLESFWQRSKLYGEPWAEQIHPDEMGVTVPIGIYGDSARIDTSFGQVEHILAFFCNAIQWRPRSVRWSRFLICCIPESRVTSETVPALLRRITWSANHAFYGFYPEVGHLGQELPPQALKRAGLPLTSKGLKFQVCELRGDWSWHKKIWRFSNNTHWNGQNVCHLCNAKGISPLWEELEY